MLIAYMAAATSMCHSCTRPRPPNREASSPSPYYPSRPRTPIPFPLAVPPGHVPLHPPPLLSPLLPPEDSPYYSPYYPSRPSGVCIPDPHPYRWYHVGANVESTLCGMGAESLSYSRWRSVRPRTARSRSTESGVGGGRDDRSHPFASTEPFLLPGATLKGPTAHCPLIC